MVNLDRFQFRVWNGKSLKDLLELSAESVYYFLNGRFSEDHILMQSTGLRDENGKLIFEGDIIDFDDDNLGVVTSEDKCVEFFIKPIKGDEEIVWDLSRYLYRIARYTVIGNIYDNGNLLDK